MLSSLFMAAFAAQVADDGFSKLQIFLQQLIDWGVSAGGRIIGAVIIFVVGRFLISFLRKMLARLLAKSCLLYTSPSPRDVEESRMPSSA